MTLFAKKTGWDDLKCDVNKIDLDKWKTVFNDPKKFTDPIL